MAFLNVNELRGSSYSRNEVVAWCIGAVSEFFSIAQQMGTKPYSRNIKYSHTPLGDRSNVTRQVKDGLFSTMQVVDFYLVLVSSQFDNNDILNEEYGAAISLKYGGFYFNAHKSTPEEIGSNIAGICGYIKDVAESLFNSALQGEPWDMDYAKAQVESYNNPRTSVIGNNNTVAGRDVFRFR